MKKLLLILCILYYGLHLHAQTVSISVVPDKNRILIGEQFHLNITTTTPLKGSFSPFKIDSIDHFEIISQDPPDSSEKSPDRVITQTLTVTSWDSGTWQIPAFIYYGKRSKPFSITVSFSPFDPKQEYHDIKEIIDVEKPKDTDWYWYLLGLLLFIVLAVLLFPGGQKSAAPPVKKIVTDPDNYKTAMDALEKLKAEMGAVSAKQFYTNLTETVRRYLKMKTTADPYTSSGSMLSKTISSLNIPDEVKNDTAEVMMRADLAKFAKYESDKNEKTNSIDTIKNLINAIEKKS